MPPNADTTVTNKLRTTHNFKEIYNIANKLMFRKEPLPLPALDDPNTVSK